MSEGGMGLAGYWQGTLLSAMWVGMGEIRASEEADKPLFEEEVE